jgi:hypothetical protein
MARVSAISSYTTTFTFIEMRAQVSSPTFYYVVIYLKFNFSFQTKYIFTNRKCEWEGVLERARARPRREDTRVSCLARDVVSPCQGLWAELRLYTKACVNLGLKTHGTFFLPFPPPPSPLLPSLCLIPFFIHLSLYFYTRV